MLILAIDTSGRHVSVALCRGDAKAFELLQLVALEGGTYSARLIPTISEIFLQQKLALAELDALAIVSGPGSFTGLRVVLATVKVLCEILHKPLVTISMLEAVVVERGSAAHSTAILDAGRGEVYVGEYRHAANAAASIREYIVKLNDFVEDDGATEQLTPDKAVFDFLQQKHSKVRLVDAVQADGIARVGLGKLIAGELADHATVDVNYIRRSDAEIFSAPKLTRKE